MTTAGRHGEICKQLIWQGNTWYDKYPWANEPVPPGTYSLRVPVSDSNYETFAGQRTLLLPSEGVAPLVLVELAMISLKKAGHSDPLNDGWGRCRETADGRRAEVTWEDERLVVDDWSDDCYDHVWLAAARKIS